MLWILVIVVGLLLVACNAVWFCLALLGKRAPSPVPLLGSLLAAAGLAGMYGLGSPWWIVVLVLDPGGLVFLIFSLLWHGRSGRPLPPGAAG